MTDSEFIKKFSGLLGALVVLAVILFFLAHAVVNRPNAQQQTDTRAVAERIKPVGEVAIGEASRGGRISLIATASAAGDDKGKAVYNSACVACHGSGVAGAPKLGDKAAWKGRIAQGAATLNKHALGGFQGKSGFMPPKGGNASLADADVTAAVDYMVSKSR